MSRKGHVPTVYLLSLTVACLLAAGGCQSYTEPRPVRAASPSENPSAAAPASASREPLQSLSEAEMVQFFHFLLEMDAKPKTTLTKKQAEAVLPLVRQNVEKGTMDEEDKQAILHTFREEQMAFYTRWNGRIAAPDTGKPSGDRPDGGLTEEEWHQWKQDWMHRTEDGNKGGPSPDVSASPGAWMPPGPFNTDPEGWTAGEKNVEQLLLERLEERITL